MERDEERPRRRPATERIARRATLGEMTQADWSDTAHGSGRTRDRASTTAKEAKAREASEARSAGQSSTRSPHWTSRTRPTLSASTRSSPASRRPFTPSCSTAAPPTPTRTARPCCSTRSARDSRAGTRTSRSSAQRDSTTAPCGPPPGPSPSCRARDETIAAPRAQGNRRLSEHAPSRRVDAVARYPAASGAERPAEPRHSAATSWNSPSAIPRSTVTAPTRTTTPQTSPPPGPRTPSRSTERTRRERREPTMMPMNVMTRPARMTTIAVTNTGHTVRTGCAREHTTPWGGFRSVNGALHGARPIHGNCSSLMSSVGLSHRRRRCPASIDLAITDGRGVLAPRCARVRGARRHHRRDRSREAHRRVR